MNWILLLQIILLIFFIYLCVASIVRTYFAERTANEITRREMIKDKKLAGL